MDITSFKLLKDAESLTVNMFEFVKKTRKACDDDVCLNICGVIQDSAYKIQRIIKQEKCQGYKHSENCQ